MRRREFIRLLGGAAMCPLAANAQKQSLPTVGYLNAYPENDPDLNEPLLRFKVHLRELGWVDGQNVRLDIRFVGSDAGPARLAAAELLRLAPAVIVSTTSTTNRALMDATHDTPIIAAVVGDPVALGFTKDISHPTANMTGFSSFNDTISGKRLEMLHDMVSTMRKAGVLYNPINPQQVLLEKQTAEAAKAAGLELLSLPVKAVDDIASALAKAHGEQVNGMIVAADPLTMENHRAIIDECLRLNLPAMHTFGYEVRHGALMAYGFDIPDNYHRAADYVDRILKGAKVADLPFQEPTKLFLAINMRTARLMNIAVPPALLALAAEVIE